MTVSDPDPRPDLEPASPSGAVAGTYLPVDHTIVDVLMTDGRWGYAEVIAQSRNIDGAWRVQLLWYAEGTQREDWFMFRAEAFREPPADTEDTAHR